MSAIVYAAATFAMSMFNSISSSRNNKAYNKAMREMELENLAMKNRGINQQLATQEEDIAQQKLQTQVQRAAQQSQAKAATADAGGAGNSATAIGEAYSTMLGMDIATLDNNLERARSYAAIQKEGNSVAAENNMYARTKDESVDVMTPITKAFGSYMTMGADEGAADKAVTETANKTGGNKSTALLIGGGSNG